MNRLTFVSALIFSCIAFASSAYGAAVDVKVDKPIITPTITFSPVVNFGTITQAPEIRSTPTPSPTPAANNQISIDVGACTLICDGTTKRTAYWGDLENEGRPLGIAPVFPDNIGIAQMSFR